jgi:Domain of unknown function (DUF4260)
MTATAATLNRSASAATRPPEAGMTGGGVRTWLRLEGVAAFGVGLALFGVTGGNWLFLVPLILLPDLSIAGYLAGPRVGAFTYNVVHTWAPGIVVLGLGAWLSSPALLIAAAILIAHVGMDRAAGYGLKLPGSFQATHLGRMGRTKA